MKQCLLDKLKYNKRKCDGVKGVLLTKYLNAINGLLFNSQIYNKIKSLMETSDE